VDFKSRMTISSTPKVEPFGKTVCVCVCVCMCVKEFFLTDIVLEGVVKVLETSQGSPPHCANFFSGAGNVSRFPTPVCNLFQWMLEMSQGSPPQCAIFFSGCWKCLKVPHPSVQSFTVDAGNILSVPTPVCKLFQWMLEMSRASQPQCANFFSGCWKCLKLPHPSVQTFSADVGVCSDTQPPLHKEMRCSCSNYLVCFSCGLYSSQIHED
jgi:hypothetical protein